MLAGGCCLPKKETMHGKKKGGRIMRVGERDKKHGMVCGMEHELRWKSHEIILSVAIECTTQL